MFKKALKTYLICCGVFLHLAALGAVYFALGHFALTPRQFLVKIVEKSSIDSPLLVSLFEPSAQYADHNFDGKIRNSHPRILLTETSALSAEKRIEFFKNRQTTFKNSPIKAPPLPCKQTHLSALTTCWVATGDSQKFDQALEKLLKFKIETPDISALYGNGWLLAFNYDLLASSPKITPSQHEIIQNKLETTIIEYLRVLDEDSASLWHGRLSLSSNAWLCAVMLKANTDKRRELISRAQGHFLDTVQSVAITETWPEGYNYWINNRGFYFALAASAYINGLEDSQHANQIKQLLERVGLWHIYATRPDNQIQGYADEGPRIDLKDETRRVIDIIASTANNKQLASYSLYLQKQHGIESYYRDYRWGFHLFNKPDILPIGSTGSLEELTHWLPKTELFGRNGSNALYLRSDWGKNSTYITYRAGHNFTHHGHYDAGHFTLFKGQPLAVNSSNYGDYTGPNRLNYSLRTVAKNSLLIQRPDEQVQPNRFFTENISDGGQRITLPTGSAIRSTKHWQENLYQGQHLEAAELEHFTQNSDYSYIQSNLTPAYNSTEYDETGDNGKVKQVQRALFYLNREDILLVHDQIETTDPSYRSKWLLHSLSKPKVNSATTLVGTTDNGILRSNDQQSVIQEKGSSLKVNILLPSDATQHLIGGNNYRYYVETDGDDKVLNGTNMSTGSKESAWFEQAKWRTEIFSSQQDTKKQFLIALAPAATGLHPINTTLLSTSDKHHYGALVNSSAVIFTQSRAQFSIQLPASVRRLYLVGPLHQPRKILLNGEMINTVQHKDIISQVLLPSNSLDKSISIEL